MAEEKVPMVVVKEELKLSPLFVSVIACVLMFAGTIPPWAFTLIAIYVADFRYKYTKLVPITDMVAGYMQNAKVGKQRTQKEVIDELMGRDDEDVPKE